MRVRHGAVAFNVTDNLPVIISDLKTPPVARIIDVSHDLPLCVRDVGARRNRGRRSSVLAITHDTTGGRWRRGHDHGQDTRCHTGYAAGVENSVS